MVDLCPPKKPEKQPSGLAQALKALLINRFPGVYSQDNDYFAAKVQQGSLIVAECGHGPKKVSAMSAMQNCWQKTCSLRILHRGFRGSLHLDLKMSYISQWLMTIGGERPSGSDRKTLLFL